ncbi:hypothetical protein [Paraburkholderia phenoliruptrix]|uniref:hypothetical protein n=1 Tax=Paraburkholderia phenoliruptrix TaxID=252970 RepID=UPI002859EBAA|nr:hypothetical protein [Paraburkholderia phenoliruptrix]MDR6393069.1 hypothetical protein [Paraburkholderia phenoliruptrix]
MSAWDSALNVVKTLAPTIATALGGPLAGGAVAALESVFGITAKQDASTDDRQTAIAAAISGATPEQLAAMRAKDQDYALAMAQAGFKDTEMLASLKVQDVSNARDMQKTTRSQVPAWLTFFVTAGFFGLLIGLFLAPVPDGAKALIYSATGTLGTVWLVVIHFWFGSTSDTTQVNDLLAKSSPPQK